MSTTPVPRVRLLSVLPTWSENRRLRTEVLLPVAIGAVVVGLSVVGDSATVARNVAATSLGVSAGSDTIEELADLSTSLDGRRTV